MITYAETYSRWLSRASEASELLAELRAIANDPAAIEDRFYRELEFGTGGLRGVLGAGSNRMNIYTVGKATQGLAEYVVLAAGGASAVAIAHDSRVNSRLFAERAAAILAANGIHVYIYPRLMPTPALSFAVRALKCRAGVMITASHNPAQYNGYKVYGSDGCQITAKVAAAIQGKISRVDPFDGVPAADFEAQLADGRIEYISDAIVERFLACERAQSLLPADVCRDVSIVYTPLNGAGISCVPDCLKANGFEHIVIPDEQRTPDGRFPTCPYPNPELHDALKVGLAWAERTGSDLLLATDPDCDRVGAAVLHNGEYVCISGNEMGALLLDYVCRMRAAQGKMPARPVAVKTIVTTPLAEKIADKYGVELHNVLTGFKYIGEQIGLLEAAGETERYIFGFEESCGYLSGSFVRDKDAVNAALLICELFCWHRQRGKTLIDALEEIYAELGYYGSRLLSFNFEGLAGFEKMRMLMAGLRENPPRTIADMPVMSKIDYLVDDTGLPKSDVLRYLLPEGEVTVRPSGTEPKIKLYLSAHSASAASTQALVNRLAGALERWMDGEKSI